MFEVSSRSSGHSLECVNAYDLASKEACLEENAANPAERVQEGRSSDRLGQVDHRPRELGHHRTGMEGRSHSWPAIGNEHIWPPMGNKPYMKVGSGEKASELGLRIH